MSLTICYWVMVAVCAFQIFIIDKQNKTIKNQGEFIAALLGYSKDDFNESEEQDEKS